MSQRPTIRIRVVVSLDGFIAPRDGGTTWREGFTGDYGDEAFVAGIGAVIMGRKTYAQAAKQKAWHYPPVRLYVMSQHALESTRGSPKVVKAGGALISRLQMMDASDGDIWVAGGGSVLRGFLDAGAVDTMDLLIAPVVLGNGMPLFPGAPVTKRFDLTGSVAYPDGIVLNSYRIRAAPAA